MELKYNEMFETLDIETKTLMDYIANVDRKTATAFISWFNLNLRKARFENAGNRAYKVKNTNIMVIEDGPVWRVWVEGLPLRNGYHFKRQTAIENCVREIFFLYKHGEIK